MTNEYIRLAVAPHLVHPGYPSCGVCDVETEHDGDGWLCPSCATSWPDDSLEDDGTRATLFGDWSGEDLTGPVCPPDFAWMVAHFPAGERDRRIREELARRKEQSE